MRFDEIAVSTLRNIRGSSKRAGSHDTTRRQITELDLCQCIDTGEDDDACTTPNMSSSPGVAKTLEWTPTANVSVGPQTGDAILGNTRQKKSDQGHFLEAAEADPNTRPAAPAAAEAPDRENVPDQIFSALCKRCPPSS